ncbi:MAG: hypothetical protein MUF62_09465, partial [Chitinophagaceae bacterium]|nr:hypothetical protein [Chitinophagaceae bacterium]
MIQFSSLSTHQTISRMAILQRFRKYGRQQLAAMVGIGLLAAGSSYAQQPAVLALYDSVWTNPNTESSTVNADGREIVADVTRPTLTYFAAKGSRGVAPAVIICPGGGYGRLAIGHEGYEVARRFAQWGIAAFVLKYR